MYISLQMYCRVDEYFFTNVELMNEQKKRMKREEHRRSVDIMLQQKEEDR